MTPVVVALAGSLGAVSRFVIDGHIRTKLKHPFPWATFFINATGSFLLGVADGVLLKHRGFASTESIIGTGFCGGYTTFSTASFETVRLFEERRYRAAFFNALGSVGITLIGAILGIALGQLL